MGTSSVFDSWYKQKKSFFATGSKNNVIVSQTRALSQTGLCLLDVHGSVWQADPPVGSCSLTPDRYWNCKAHTVKGSMGIFYNFDQSTSSSEKCFLTDPYLISTPWRPRSPASLHRHIPHTRNVAVLHLIYLRSTWTFTESSETWNETSLNENLEKV